MCYCTKDRDSGLQFGTVHKIKVVDTTESYVDENKRWQQRPAVSYKIQFLRTDPHGVPKYERVFDPEAPNPSAYDGSGKGMFVVSDKQEKSGYVEIYGQKFLVL